MKAKKPNKPKKRAKKYEQKLAVNLSFEELVAVSLAPSKPKKSKS
jgi:hypothetical protein